MVEAFEIRQRSDKAYVWEISNTTRWKKTAEAEVEDRIHDLEMHDELIFIFRLYQTKKASTAQNLAERLARIILELPAKFAYKKVIIMDPSILDVQTCQKVYHAQFEWEKFLFYTMSFVFKELWICGLRRQGLNLMGLLCTRTACLFMKDCEISAGSGSAGQLSMKFYTTC